MALCAKQDPEIPDHFWKLSPAYVRELENLEQFMYVRGRKVGTYNEDLEVVLIVIPSLRLIFYQIRYTLAYVYGDCYYIKAVGRNGDFHHAGTTIQWFWLVEDKVADAVVDFVTMIVFNGL